MKEQSAPIAAPDTSPMFNEDMPAEIEEIRVWMGGGKRPSFATDTLSDASVAYLSIDRLLRGAGKVSAPNSANEGAAQADPLELVERWLAQASEVSWGSDMKDGGWSNMPKSILQAVADEARRGRQHLVEEHPLYHGEGPEHESEPEPPDPLCHFGKAIPGQRCTKEGVWRSPTIEHQTWLWCDDHKFKGDVPVAVT